MKKSTPAARARARAPSRHGLRFSQVRLTNWRNFAHADVALQRRVFLVGPNASGKSNFLDVFRFLHDVVAVGGGFQDAVRKRGGVSLLRCLAARRDPKILIQVRIAGDDPSPVWDYELSFTQDNQRRAILTSEQVTKDGNIILNRPKSERYRRFLSR